MKQRVNARLATAKAAHAQRAAAAAANDEKATREKERRAAEKARARKAQLKGRGATTSAVEGTRSDSLYQRGVEKQKQDRLKARTSQELMMQKDEEEARRMIPCTS